MPDEPDRLRTALEEILRLVTPPADAAVGTLANGEIGKIWPVGAMERAFDEIARIAHYALRDDAG